MTYEQYVQYIDEYFIMLQDKFERGRLGHKEYRKSLLKLEQWENHFVEKEEEMEC